MSKKNIKLPPLLIEFGKIFTAAGYKAYLVGGAVRDMFMKVPAHDWDVATNATPQDVIKLFKKQFIHNALNSILYCNINLNT